MAHSDYEKSFRKIIKDLSKGIMKIEFYKVNTHDYRLAYGTTNPQLVTDYGFYWQDTGKSPQELEEDLQKDMHNGIIRFYDLQRGGWRSLRYDHSIGLTEYSKEFCELPENSTLT
ncbi:SH3 beta-barrel fold-containing protein [Paenibacillus pabuli]|uniref:SH3 beta-barrel fold-containing protein n=1 Tax=Paenibacillus pabuli TaxID=1472 RepID=UPI00324215C6